MRGINDLVQPQAPVETAQAATSSEKVHSKVKTQVKVTGERICNSEYHTGN